MDISSLKPGDDWEREIYRAIKEARVFVLCWCCQAERSAFIAREIAAALRDRKKRLVPVRFCPAPLPEPLARRQWIDLRGHVRHGCAHRSGGGAVPPVPSPAFVGEPVHETGRPSGRGLAILKRVAWSRLVPLAFAVLLFADAFTAGWRIRDQIRGDESFEGYLITSVTIAAVVLFWWLFDGHGEALPDLMAGSHRRGGLGHGRGGAGILLRLQLP